MRKLRKIFNRTFRLTLSWLFVLGPPLVCFFVLYHFSINEFQGVDVKYFYKLVTAAIAVTATLSGLTLNLSSRIKNDENRADIFRTVGERFLHAVLLLVMALIVKFAEIQMIDHITTLWIYNIIAIYFKILLLFFFYYGVGYFVFALMLAHKKLLEGNEKPFD